MLLRRFSALSLTELGGLEERGGGLRDASEAPTSKSGSREVGEDSLLLKENFTVSF